MARFNFEKPLWHIQNSNISRLHLWAIEDIRCILVEDDGLPVQVTCTGHCQEGQEEDGEHDVEAPGLVRQLCRIRTGAGAQDWLVRLAAWLPAATKAGWALEGGVRGRIHLRLPAFYQPFANLYLLPNHRFRNPQNYLLEIILRCPQVGAPA